MVKEPRRGDPKQFRLALDVMAELDLRAGPRGRGRTIERCVRRYARLVQATRKSLERLVTDEELRFLIEIYPGLLLDQVGAAAFWKQVAQAIKISNVARPRGSERLIEKLKKLDLLCTTALLDTIEQARTAAVRGTAEDFGQRAATEARKILAGGRV